MNCIVNKPLPLETQRVGKLMFQLAVPSICAQLISLLYSVVDRIYLGHIPDTGTQVLSGIGIVVPVITIINAFSNLIGMGGGPLAAIALGEKNLKQANRIMWNSLCFTVVIALMLTTFMLIFKKSILSVFGVDEAIYKYAEEYYVICSLGSLFSIGTLVINMFLTTQGKNKISMFIVCAGAVFNLIFDPIFIFVLGLGLKGAALVTVISQAGTTIAGFIFLMGKKSILKIEPQRLNVKIFGRICKLGFAQFFATSTESLINIVYNRQFFFYGNEKYVAAFSVIFTISQILILPLNGMMQGAQPIISVSYGGRNLVRLRSAIKYCIISGTLFEFAGTIIVEIFARQIFGIFSSDSNFIELGILPMRIFILGRLFGGVQWSIQTIHRSTGQALRATIIPIFRKLILIVPLCFIIPTATGLGTTGVAAVEPISDLCAQIFSIIIFIPFYRKLDS